jgi:hypothetical protein
MKKYRFYLLGCVLSLFLLGCNTQCFLNPEDITNMYSSYVEQWTKEVKTSFDDAEKEIFNKTPKPDVIIKPDPDPAKCICKGTGIIVQGDGHKTTCEYHGKKEVQQKSVNIIRR